MKFLNILMARLRALLGRDKVLNEIDEEMKAHIELEADANRERGMTPEEARRSAMESFGNVGSIRDLAYDVKGGGFLETLWQDVRYCGRMLTKHPSFTLIIVLTLALGIGANTATFSIVNAVLLRPFPYDAPERLVILQESVAAGGGFSPSYPNYVDWRAQNTVCSSMAAVRTDESFNFTDAGDPERLQGRLVTSEFFSTLGIKPLVGRDFLADEDRQGATPTAILSYGFWERRFGGDRNILGKQLTLNNQSFTVIGV